MVTFKANRMNLLQTLKSVKVAVRGKRANTLTATCEITITDGKAAFAVPGAVFSAEGITQGACKATVPFLHFMQIIKDSTAAITEISITEGSVQINTVTLSAQTTFFETDRILRTIQLPINFTDADILRLPTGGYTWEELAFNKLKDKIYKAEEKLEENIMQAYIMLKQYGVTYEALGKFVKSNLFSAGPH